MKLNDKYAGMGYGLETGTISYILAIRSGQRLLCPSISVRTGPGKMRKVKCGMDGAEICCGMVCKVRNASLTCILGVLLHSDHPYVPKGVREVQFTLSATKFSEIYNN